MSTTTEIRACFYCLQRNGQSQEALKLLPMEKGKCEVCHADGLTFVFSFESYAEEAKA